LWMILHFQEQHAHIDRADVQHELKRYIPSYEKEVPCDQLHACYTEAARRAQELDAWQGGRGCEGANPSTGVYKLTERIMNTGRKRD
jgi:hypothetical protein